MDKKKRLEELKKDTRNYLSYLMEIGVESLPIPRKHRDSPRQFEDRGKRLEAKTSNLQPQTSNKIPRIGTVPSVPRISLKSIREELGDCKRCKLHKGRTNIVFGVGNPKAEIVFVGEGPGRDEDLKGEPFVGRAGQLLTKIIEAMGLKRSDVYICNVVKCRPPNNRNPEHDEIATCRPFLEKQIDSIKPKTIVALGSHAAHTLLNTQVRISDLRGKFNWYRNGIKVMPTYHPAFLLRNDSKKKETWEDMKMIMKELKLPGKRRK
ncbi:MAG: uracil-DNA glycosylase [Thermodesulfobacteriota bacterium]